MLLILDGGGRLVGAFCSLLGEGGQFQREHDLCSFLCSQVVQYSIMFSGCFMSSLAHLLRYVGQLGLLLPCPLVPEFAHLWLCSLQWLVLCFRLQ